VLTAHSQTIIKNRLIDHSSVRSAHHDKRQRHTLAASKSSVTGLLLALFVMACTVVLFAMGGWGIHYYVGSPRAGKFHNRAMVRCYWKKTSSTGRTSTMVVNLPLHLVNN
jgi:hypothetical protein